MVCYFNFLEMFYIVFYLSLYTSYESEIYIHHTRFLLVIYTDVCDMLNTSNIGKTCMQNSFFFVML